MKHIILTSIVITATLTLTCVPSMTWAQTDNSKYIKAKGFIKQARALLREYLHDNPNGTNAYNANLQLKALENLIATDIPITPVPLENGITWRILSVQPNEAYTKIHIEFENTNLTSDSSFHWFDKWPLILLANGKAYAMKGESLKLPEHTNEVNAGGNFMCLLQGGQIVTADLYFEPFDDGATVGDIKYSHRDSANLAHFSLLNTNQRVKP